MLYVINVIYVITYVIYEDFVIIIGVNIQENTFEYEFCDSFYLGLSKK
jgi:hypothetical protein